MNVYVSLPLCGSVFIELRDEWVGFGQVKYPRGDKEIFLGRIQLTYSPSQRPIGILAKSLMIMLIAMVGIYGTTNMMNEGTSQQELEVTKENKNPLFTNYPEMDKENMPK